MLNNNEPMFQSILRLFGRHLIVYMIHIEAYYYQYKEILPFEDLDLLLPVAINT